MKSVIILYLLTLSAFGRTLTLYPGAPYRVTSVERSCEFATTLPNPIFHGYKLVCGSHGDNQFRTVAKGKRSKWNHNNVIIKLDGNRAVKTKSVKDPFSLSIHVEFIENRNIVMRATCEPASWGQYYCTDSESKNIVKVAFYSETGHLIRAVVPVRKQRFEVTIADDIDQWQVDGLLMVLYSMIRK